MASPSLQRGAARAPPPPDQLASLYKLLDKQTIAGALGRHARHAELSASAAVQAETLFGGDDSLVVKSLRVGECHSLLSRTVEASRVEQEALFRRAWAALVSLLPLLLRRIEASTLLPGTIREEELDYEDHAQATLTKAKNKPDPSPSGLRAVASTMGYTTLLTAIVNSLTLLRLPLWPAVQKIIAESFVFQGLDVIPLTAGIDAKLIIGEDLLLAVIEEGMKPQKYDPGFCAAFLLKWRSDAVRSVLQSRGVLQNGIAAYHQDFAEFEVRQRRHREGRAA